MFIFHQICFDFKLHVSAAFICMLFYHGFESTPKQWIDDLKGKDMMNSTLKKVKNKTLQQLH